MKKQMKRMSRYWRLVRFGHEILIAIGGAFIFLGLVNFSIVGGALYWTVVYWIAGGGTIAVGIFLD